MQAVIATVPLIAATIWSVVTAFVSCSDLANAPRILTAPREKVAAHQNASQDTRLASGIPATPSPTAKETR